MFAQNLNPVFRRRKILAREYFGKNLIKRFQIFRFDQGGLSTFLFELFRRYLFENFPFGDNSVFCSDERKLGKNVRGDEKGDVFLFVQMLILLFFLSYYYHPFLKSKIKEWIVTTSHKIKNANHKYCY